MTQTLTDTEAKKLTQLIEDGAKILQEIDDLKGGLRDTVKAVAEELSLKPKHINRAIRAEFKGNLEEEKDAVNQTEEILAAAGKA